MASPIGHARVERGERVLEDDLDLPAHLPHGAAVQLGQLRPVELDRARRRLDELQHGPTGGRLAAPGLADEAEGLARGDAEGDAADGVDDADLVPDERPAAHREVLDQVCDLQQRPGRAPGAGVDGAELGDRHAIDVVDDAVGEDRGHGRPVRPPRRSGRRHGARPAPR